MQHHQWPIIKVALAAIGSFLAVALLHLDAFSASALSLDLLGWVFVEMIDLESNLVKSWKNLAIEVIYDDICTFFLGSEV